MNLNFEEIFLFIISPELQDKIFPIKIIFIILSIVLTIYTIYLLRVSTWWAAMFSRDIEELGTYKGFGTHALGKRWSKILRRVKTDTPSEVKLAIIEADRILEDVLERMGYSGKSTGERLERLSTDYVSNIDQLWEAHRLRNNIVHDPNYRLSFSQSKKAITAYGQAFKELEVI